MDKKSELKLIILCLTLLLITSIGVSFAYFSTAVTGNYEDITIASGTMRLSYEETRNVSLTNALPGDYATKEFSVKNIGTLTSTYNVWLTNVFNYFTDKTDLVYSLTSNDANVNITNIQAPASDGSITDEITIEPNETHHYTLTITFLNKNERQNDNQGASFSGMIDLNNYSYIEDMKTVKSYIALAQDYYDTVKNDNSITLGTNVIDRLNITDNNAQDQLVLTNDGKVELAVLKNNRCYRKSALSDEIRTVEEEFCDVSVDRYASNNGRLHVTGSKLLNERNEEVRLTGVSNSEPPLNSQAIREQGDMYTYKSMQTLNTWGGNIFRIFINSKYYTYTNEEKEQLMNDLKYAIDNMIANDMYVNLNWQPGNKNVEAAKAFFTEIGNMYPNDPHILYEIWNEPNDVTWQTVKDYANEVIPVIRSISPDAIVIVGSPKWDSRLDYVIADPLDIPNIMYSHHTYMNQFNDEFYGYFKQAIDAGLPIFETETQGVATGTPVGSYLNDAQAYTFYKILEQNNISYTLFCWDAGMWSYNFVAYKEHKWNEELPDSILRESGKFSKRLLRGEINTTAYMMKGTTNTGVGSDYRSSEWKDLIVSVSFKKEDSIPDDAEITWDLSYLQDETIIGYLMPSTTENMYDLIISSKKAINLPTDSRSLFRGLTNVKSYDFTNARTDLVSTMAYMFASNSSLETLDLSSFDTEELTDIGSMFAGCTNLTSINFDNWHPTLYDFVGVFYNCNKLVSLNLSEFNVTNAKNFQIAFYGNTSLTTLNISTWKPTNVTNLKSTFSGCKVLEEIDLSGFTKFSSSCDFTNTFALINNNVVIKTGNETFKNDMQTAYPNLNIQ